MHIKKKKKINETNTFGIVKVKKDYFKKQFFLLLRIW